MSCKCLWNESPGDLLRKCSLHRHLQWVSADKSHLLKVTPYGTAGPDLTTDWREYNNSSSQRSSIFTGLTVYFREQVTIFITQRPWHSCPWNQVQLGPTSYVRQQHHFPMSLISPRRVCHALLHFSPQALLKGLICGFRKWARFSIYEKNKNVLFWF